MRKRNEERAAELREEIKLCLSSKRMILSDRILLNEKLHNSVIDESEYKKELSKRYDGKTQQEWLDFCNNRISRSQKEIESCEDIERTQQNLAIPLALLVIIFLAAGFFVFKPTLTGYVIASNELNYTQNLGLVVDSYAEHAWFLEHPGDLKSLKLTGSVTNDGYAQVYILHNGVKYVVFDSDNLKEEGVIGITGMVVLDETETNETQPTNETSNETITNETDIINETNQSINQTNETISINETITNETEPLENISINKIIKINLEYASGANYDPDNNGVEGINGIIDFTVENTDFSWNADFSKVCTKWETYSIDDEQIITVCYGSDNCCNFIGLMPTSLEWDEVFLSAYMRHGASVNNVISSQVLYVDYNTSLDTPYTDIHNSEWADLNASYYESEVAFNDVCVDTCLLSGFNETFYTLVFNVSNAIIVVDSVDYSVLEGVEGIGLVNVTVSNIASEETIQYNAVIGKPVKWKKIIKLINKTDNLTIVLPNDARNISVNKIVNKSLKEKVEKAKIKIKDRVNYVDTYNLITGYAVSEEELDYITELIIEEEVEEIEIEYETPAPEATESEISSNRKQVVISSVVHYTDILAYTTLPKEAREGQVKLYWLTDSGREIVNFDAYDLNNNSLVDYIEWVIPSLSNQTYEIIIEISSAEHLDMNRSFVADIYEYVNELDGNWSYAIPAGDYVRVTFREELDSSKDITLYARSNSSASIEVYIENGNESIVTFYNITNESYYKVYLTELNGSYSTFDLKVLGDSVEFDYIVDPVASEPISRPAGDGFRYGLTTIGNDTLFCNWDRLCYQNMSNGYFSVRDTSGNELHKFGFGITSNEINRSVLDFSWNWSYADDTFTAISSQPQFTWIMNFSFDPSAKMKITHYVENNYQDLTDAKLWYIFTVNENDTATYNGTVYNLSEDLHKQGNFNDAVAKINFPTAIFDFNDTLAGFTVTDIYVGSAAMFGRPGIRIFGVAITKGAGNFNKGRNITADPTITQELSSASGSYGLYFGKDYRESPSDYSVTINESQTSGWFSGSKPMDIGANRKILNISLNSLRDFNVNDSVLLLLRFEEGSGTTAFDESKYGNDGTITDAVYNCSYGRLGKCVMDFDGVNDYVRISDTIPLNFTVENFTIMGWARFNDETPTKGSLISKGNWNQANQSYGLVFYSNSVRFFGNGNWATAAGTSWTPYFDNGWHFYVGVRDGSQDILYIDGELKNNRTGEYTALMTTSAYVDIGKLAEENNYYLNGSIDSVIIINRSLTSQEIFDMYNATKINYIESWANATIINIRVSEGNSSDNYSPQYESDDNKVNLTGLVGFWNMDNTTQSGNATAIFDTSGNGNDGQLSGRTDCRNVTGFIDSGCEFKSSSPFAKVQFDKPSINGTSSWTFTSWVFRRGGSSAFRIFSAHSEGSNADFREGIAIAGAGSTQLEISGKLGGKNFANYWNTYVWIHLVVVYDSPNGDLFVYKDGELFGSKLSANANVDFNHTIEQLGVGYENVDVYNFFGLIDQVMIFNRSLSASEVTTLYETSALKYTDWGEPDSFNEEEYRFIQYNVSMESNSVLYSEYVLNVTLDYNEPPTTIPKINFTDNPLNRTTANVTCFNTTQNDDDGDTLFNSYNWFINNQSLTVLNMPFDTKHNASNWTKDFSGYGNDGQYQGGAYWNQTGGINGSGAYEFDGVDDYIELGSNPNLGTVNSASVSVWYKTETLTTKQAIVGEADSSTRFGLGLLILGTSDRIRGYCNDDSSNLAFPQETTTSGEWHLATVTYKLGNCSLYIDGEYKESSGTAIDSLTLNSWEIGRWTGFSSDFFNGTIDEVMIFNRSLSASQIRAMYIDGKQRHTLVSDETITNDVVKCQITTSDGLDYTQRNSTALTVNANSVWHNTGYPYANKSFMITEFIKVSGTEFTLAGQPYVFLGADSYYLADYATNHTYDDDGNEINNSRQYVIEILNKAQYLGFNVIRTWASSQGGHNSVWEINETGGHYNLFEVQEPGNYSEDMFVALDWVIYQASQRDIRLQLVLVNNWNDYGGMRWYVQQSPTTDKTYENVTDDSYANWSIFHDQFYTDENVKQYFRNYINHTLNRVNTYTGIAYKDEPAIFAWMLANEPRAKSDGYGTKQLLVNWTKNMTAYIKSIDTNHLVGLGIEGWGNPWEGTSFIDDHNGTGVDYATYALHPDQWEWFGDRSEHETNLDWADEGSSSEKYTLWWTNESGLSYNNRYEGSYIPDYNPSQDRHTYDNWVEQHITWSDELGLPIILQEAGYGTDHTKEIKDLFYQTMIHNFYNSGGDGLMLWTLNHDEYYYSTTPNGTMDDGYGFYVSDDAYLKNKSLGVRDAIDFTKVDNDGASWIVELNSYNYLFVSSVGIANDASLANATLYLNISNGTAWREVNYVNESAIYGDNEHVFTVQFNDTDDEAYWYIITCTLTTCINSTSEHIQIRTGTPVITLLHPDDGGIYSGTSMNFNYSVTETEGLEMNNCELYINGNLNQTDVIITRDIVQTFPVTDLYVDREYTWYIKCTDIDDNIGTSETRTFSIDNVPPTISIPKINFTDNPLNKTTANITCFNTTQSDDDGDALFNSYNWFINNQSLTVLNMPFDTKHNASNWTKDFSGYSNDGQYQGGAYWNQTGGINGSGAYEFDGSDGYKIQITDMVWGRNITAFSTSTWVNLIDDGSADWIIMRDNIAFYLRVSYDGTMVFRHAGLSTGSSETIAGAVLYNEWQNIITTWDGTYAKIYVNGVLKKTSAVLTGTFEFTTDTLNIGLGTNNDAQVTNGTIDEIKIFNRSLSANQIYAMYIDGKDKATLVSDETSADDIVKCQITTSDGTDYTQANSSEITIQSCGAPLDYGNWTITAAERCVNREIIIDSFLNITTTGSLTLINISLLFNSTSTTDGLDNYGTLHINNSNLTAHSSAATNWDFDSFPGSTLTLYDNRFDNITNYMYLDSVNNSILVRNTFENSSNGNMNVLYLESSSSAWIERNSFYPTIQNYTAMITLTGTAKNNIIFNNTFYGKSPIYDYVYGLYINESVTLTNISTNLFNLSLPNFQGAIYVTGSANSQFIEDNVIVDSYYYPIYITTNHSIIRRNNLTFPSYNPYYYIYSIYLVDSFNNTLSDNELFKPINVSGSSVIYFNHTIDTTNTINGKPLLYYFDNTNQLVQNNDSIGHILAHYTTNLTIINITIADSGGIHMYNSINTTIVNSTFIGSQYTTVPLFYDFNGVGSVVKNNSIDGQDIFRWILWVVANDSVYDSNYFENNAFYDTDFWSFTFELYDSNLTNNRFAHSNSGHYSRSIYILGDRNLISGNIYNETGTEYKLFDLSGDDNSYISNYFQWPYTFSMDHDITATNSRFINNTFRWSDGTNAGNGRDMQLHISGSGNNFTNNVFERHIEGDSRAEDPWMKISGANNIFTDTIMDCSGGFAQPPNETCFVITAAKTQFINSTFNQTNVSFTGSGELNVSWYLDANVSTTRGIPVADANITAYDGNDVLRKYGLTGSDGEVRFVLQEYYQDSSSITYYNNYTINLSLSLYTTTPKFHTVNFTMTTNTKVSFTRNCYYPSTGQWNITGNVTCSDETIILNGNIFVNRSGILILDNITLQFNITSTADGIDNNGTLIINNSNITAHSSAATNWDFDSFAGSTLTLYDNRFDNITSDIYLDSVNNSRIVGNVFAPSPGRNFLNLINPYNAWIERNNFTERQVDSGLYNYIALRGTGTNNTIFNNTFTTTVLLDRGRMIYLTGAITHTNITYNTFNFAPGHYEQALYFEGSANNQYIEDNTFTLLSTGSTTKIWHIATNNSIFQRNVIAGVVLTSGYETYNALYLYRAFNNSFYFNNITGAMFYFDALSIDHFNHTIDQTNLFANQPIRYIFNTENTLIENNGTSGGLGAILAAMTQNLTLRNLTFTGGGVYLYNTSNTTLVNSSFTGTVDSISKQIVDLNGRSNEIYNNTIIPSSSGGSGVTAVVYDSSYYDNYFYADSLGSYSILFTGYNSNFTRNTMAFGTINSYGYSIGGSDSLISNNIHLTASISRGLFTYWGTNMTYQHNTFRDYGAANRDPTISTVNSTWLNNTIIFSSGHPSYQRHLIISGSGNTFTDFYLNDTGTTAGTPLIRITGADNTFYDTLINCPGVSGYFGTCIAIQNNVSFINTTFNQTNVSFTSDNYLNVSWYLDADVSTTRGIPVADANITAYDGNDVLRKYGLTGSDGEVRFVLQEYYQDSSGITYYNNYTINLSSLLYTTTPKFHTVNFTRTNNTKVSFTRNCNYPSTGQWNITGNVTCSDETIILNGNINVTVTGSLTLDNVTLMMNSTTDGEFGVYNHGALFINNSNVTAWNANGSFDYQFFSYAGANLTLEDNNFSAIYSNLTIYSNGSRLVGNYFQQPGGLPNGEYRSLNHLTFIDVSNAWIERNTFYDLATSSGCCAIDHIVFLMKGTGTGNTIYNNTFHLTTSGRRSQLLKIQDSVTHTNISYNTFDYNEGRQEGGLWITGNANSQYIENNDFIITNCDDYSYRHPLRIDTNHSIIRGNNISGTGIEPGCIRENGGGEGAGSYSLGIYLSNAYNNTFTDNTISRVMFSFNASSDIHYNNSIDETNLIGGQPIRYIFNTKDILIRDNGSASGLGAVLAANVENLTMINLSFTDGGVYLFSTSNVTLTNSSFDGTAESNRYLLYDVEGRENKVYNNIINVLSVSAHIKWGAKAIVYNSTYYDNLFNCQINIYCYSIRFFGYDSNFTGNTLARSSGAHNPYGYYITGAGSTIRDNVDTYEGNAGRGAFSLLGTDMDYISNTFNSLGSQSASLRTIGTINSRWDNNTIKISVSSSSYTNALLISGSGNNFTNNIFNNTNMDGPTDMVTISGASNTFTDSKFNCAGPQTFDASCIAIQNNVTFINATFNETNVTFTSDNYLNVSWYLDIHTNRSDNGNDVPFVNISSYDVNGVLRVNTLTDSSGLTMHTLQEYMFDSSGKTFYTNYSINTTKPGYVNSSTNFNITSGTASTTLTIELDGKAPSILFEDPTLANASHTANDFVLVNISITTQDNLNISEFKWEWNGTNYTIYNDSLVLMFNFDNVSAIGEAYNNSNDSIALDVSAYSNDGRNRGDLVWNVTGKYGGAFEFDGVNDFINITNTENFNFVNQSFTISHWTYLRDVRNWAGVVGKYSSISDYITGWGDGGRFRLYIGDGAHNNYFTNQTISLNRWMHFTAVYNFSDIDTERGVYLYIDGILDANYSSVAIPKITTDSNVLIGRDGGGAANYFNGSIDEVRIYNRSLTADEIWHLYTTNLNKYDTDSWRFYANESNLTDGSSFLYAAHVKDEAGNWNNTEQRNVTIDTYVPAIDFVAPTPDNNSITGNDFVYVNITSNDSNKEHSVVMNWNDTLVSWWRMDDRNASHLFDYMNRNNGTITGADYATAGKFGGAFEFDGVDDYVTFTSFPQTNNITVSFWVNREAEQGSSGGRLIDHSNNNGLIIKPGGYVYAYNGSSLLGLGTISAIPSEVWTYYTLTIEGESVTTYLNGVADGSAVLPGGYNDIAGGFTIGRRHGLDQEYFNGTIDDVMIFSRALGAAEVAALYNATQYEHNFTNLVDANYTYTAYAQDLAGNINSTTRTLTVDLTPPSYRNFQNNDSGTTLINGYVNWSVVIEDYTNVSSFIFSYNGTGSWIADDPVTINGTSVFVNVTKQVTVPHGYICANFTFNDTWNRWNSTGLSCFTMANSLPTTGTPIINSSPLATNTTNETLNCFNVSSTDDDGDLIVYDVTWFKNGTKNASMFATDENLVLYLPFDSNESSGGTEITRDYALDNDGNVTNGTVWNATGKVRGGYEFDETDAAIKIPDSSTLDIISHLTVSAWFYPTHLDDADDFQSVVAKIGTDAITANWMIEIQFNTDDLVFYVSPSAACRISNADVLDVEQWYHAVLVFNNSGDNFLRSYINGVETGSRECNATPPSTNNNSMGIGAYYDDTGARQDEFSGKIDEVMVFNRSLSAAEVKQMYDATRDGFGALNRNMTLKHERWLCQLTPIDYLSNGTPMNSTNLTILNSPPFFNTTIPDITENTADAWSYSMVNVTDVDGDTLTYYINDSRLTFDPPYINDTAVVADLGTSYINVSVSDGEANTSYIFTYTVGDVPPSSGNNQTNGSNALKKNGTIQLNLTLTDAAGLSWYFFAWNDSGNMKNVSNDSISGTSYILIINKTATKKGWHSWKVTFNDTAGQWSNSSTFGFDVYNTLPSVPEIIYPENNSNKTQIDINFSSTDIDDEDAINYTVFINDTYNISARNNITDLTIGDGNWRLKVSAYDQINYSQNSSEIILTKDSTKPEITLLYPGDNAIIKSDGNEFRYNVSDLTAITNCSLIMDGSAILSANSIVRFISQSFLKSYNEDGEHTWSINCTDSAGNIGNSAVYSLTVEIPPPPEPDVGGIGGAITPTIELVEYDVSVKTIEIKLRLGRATTKEIRIKNTGATKIDFVLYPRQLSRYVFLSEDKFTLEIGEEKTIILNIVGEDLGLHIGQLTISGSGVRTLVPMVLAVESDKKLFDVKMDIPTDNKELAPGQDLKAQITLFNIVGGEVDVTVNYIIKDMNGYVVSEESEIFRVEDQKSYLKTYTVPEMEPGTYVAVVEVRYEGSFAVSSDMFNVAGDAASLAPSRAARYMLIYVLLGMIVLFLLFVFARYLGSRKLVPGRKPKQQKFLMRIKKK